METIARIMEKFWLVLAVASALWAGYALAVQGWDKGRTWLFFPVVATAMWGYRRFTRKRMAKWAEHDRMEKEHHGR